MIDIQALVTWPSVGQERDNVNLSFKSLGAQSAIELDLARPQSRQAVPVGDSKLRRGEDALSA
jgi:hypothetical protein